MRKKWGSKRKEGKRERRERKQRETDRSAKAIFIACASLTSAYAYKCGHEVRAHPASSTAITL